MADITHIAEIKAPAHKIYELLATKTGMRQWLRKEDGWEIMGDEQLGDTLLFYFHEGHHEMSILKLDEDKEVKWECRFGHPEWLGTTVSFLIQDSGVQCALRFSHNGWEDKTGFFEQCDKVWAGYVQDIKKLAEV
jgi:uncharacterized protein YndB with AHSA1/START domain